MRSLRKVLVVPLALIAVCSLVGACNTAGTAVKTAESDRACRGRSTSTLDGVEIHFAAERCEWSRDELAAGIRIAYRIDVRQPGLRVRSFPADAGGCMQPGPSGLIVLEEVQGHGQYYGVRDLGLCQYDEEDVAPTLLQRGSHTLAVEWDGRNWSGPSDTDNPRGAAFPAGEYEVTVTAVGQLADGSVEQFKISGTLPIAVR